MTSYSIKELLDSDLVIYPSNSPIIIKNNGLPIAEFYLRENGLFTSYQNNTFIQYLGGQNNHFIPTKYRIRQVYEIVQDSDGYYAWQYIDGDYHIQYYTDTTNYGGDWAGEDKRGLYYYNLGRLTFKNLMNPLIQSGATKISVGSELFKQKSIMVTKKLKTIDNVNSGQLKINNQTMSLK